MFGKFGASLNSFLIYMKSGLVDLVTKSGYDDLEGQFSKAQSGSSSPTWVTRPNGIRVQRFDVGDSVHVAYHVPHPYKLQTNGFHHVHWFPDTNLAQGEQVVWEISVLVVRGHAQTRTDGLDEGFNRARTVFTITHTADSESLSLPSGSHFVTEALNPDAYDLKEPDTNIMVEVKLLSSTYSGDIFATQSDIHFEVDKINTPFKIPPFSEV